MLACQRRVVGVVDEVVRLRQIALQSGGGCGKGVVCGGGCGEGTAAEREPRKRAGVFSAAVTSRPQQLVAACSRLQLAP